MMRFGFYNPEGESFKTYLLVDYLEALGLVHGTTNVFLSLK